MSTPTKSQASSPFQRAKRTQAKLRLGIAGPSGSGKTYSALLIAAGLGGRIAVIDTEHGSAALYDELIEFDTACLTEPYTPARYIELIDAAELAGYDTIVVDSGSHAWAGSGGLLDEHNKISKRTGNSFTAWRDITPQHNRLVDTLLQSSAHIICTLRSKQTHEVSNENGKLKVQKLGLAPVQREGMEYEFTVFLDMDMEHNAEASKDRTGLFATAGLFQPSVKTGEMLKAWLERGEPAPSTTALFDEYAERIQAIKNMYEASNWKKKHQDEINDHFLAGRLTRKQALQLANLYEGVTEKLTPEPDSYN